MLESLPDHLLDKLKELGRALDIKQPVFVYDGGRVDFSDVDEREEVEDVQRYAAGGSAAGSWKRAEAGQGAPPARRGAFFGSGLSDPGQAGISDLLSSYPGCKVAHDPDGIWLMVPAHPLGARGPSAIFVVAVPNCGWLPIKGWGFWLEGPEVQWIGPRHTNYPDGSICAFPQKGKFWKRSDGLCRLIDFYCEWATRHLYLRFFRRWPGLQEGPTALYRASQYTPGDICIRHYPAEYHQCCYHTDLQEIADDPDSALIETLKFTGWVILGRQIPPRNIMLMVSGSGGGVALREIYPDAALQTAVCRSLFQSQIRIGLAHTTSLNSRNLAVSI